MGFAAAMTAHLGEMIVLRGGERGRERLGRRRGRINKFREGGGEEKEGGREVGR